MHWMLPVGDWNYASCAVESDGAGVKGAGGMEVIALAVGDDGGGSEDATADDEAGGDATSAGEPAVDAIAGAVGTAGAG